MKRIFSLLLCILVSLAAFSQIPNVIPYQGNIADTSGKGFDGNFNFSFKILDNNSATLWSSGTINLPVTKGNYSASLGETGQPSISNSVWQNNIIFLEISFDDGTNGMETLNPNVQILPVPYALRAAIADSATNVNGQLGWGDSLVLRDASGDVRFVINPNTGEFKILQNDTVWYKLESNSPPKETIKASPRNGLESGVETRNGQEYSYLSGTLGNRLKWKHLNKISDAKHRLDTTNISEHYDKNGCVIRRKVTVNDTITNITREYTTEYDCPSGSILRFRCETTTGAGVTGDVIVGHDRDTKTEKKTDDGKKEETTEDMRSGNKVKVIADAKDSCYVIEANKIVLKTSNGEYVIKINDDGTTSKVSKINGSTGRTPKTTIDQDKKIVLYENQDNFIWKPEGKTQNYEIIIDNKDTLKWSGDKLGFHFDNTLNTTGIKTDSVRIQYDGKDRLVLKADVDGNSIIESYDAGSNVIKETRNPKDSIITYTGVTTTTFEYDDASNSVTHQIREERRPQDSTSALHGVKTKLYDGLERVVYDERDLIYQTDIGDGKVKKSIQVKTSSNTLKWEYDANNNLVRREANATSYTQKHEKDSTIKFEFKLDNSTAPDNFFIVDPKGQDFSFGNPNGSYTFGNTNGLFVQRGYDVTSNRSIIFQHDFADSSETKLGINKTGFVVNTVQTGYEFDDGTSWFGSRDTSNKHEMALGFSIPDSTITLFGGRYYQTFSPSSTFRNTYTDGNSSIGEEWDFGTSTKTTAGINTLQYVYNNSSAFIFESPNPAQLVIVGGDTSGNLVAIELLPAQNMVQLSAGRNPTVFSADFLNANRSCFVADTAFIGKAANIDGNVQINGNLQVNGNVTKGGGTFRIDHPQDPDNKYLYHSFVESPEMMNVYNGIIQTDSNGEAIVQLPNYFESLNRTFRYQLTCIGTFSQAIVFEEIEGNRFVIKTDQPNVKVSWQVTGVRKDTYANENRVEVEVAKEPDMIGKRLYYPKQSKR